MDVRKARMAVVENEDGEKDDVSPCCVCFDSEHTELNPFIFCDRCGP